MMVANSLSRYQSCCIVEAHEYYTGDGFQDLNGATNH